METVDRVAKRKSLHCEATIADDCPPSKIRRISHRPCDGSQSVIRNYRNFLESRPPRRVMFFEDGEWHDFPGNVMVSLVDTFRAKRSVVDVSMRNCAYLIDFVNMVMIDQKSGVRQSVAWIDEAEKCFFPMLCFDGDDMRSNDNDNEIQVKLEIQIGALDNLEREEPNMISNAKLEEEVSSEIKEVVAENGISIPNIFEFEGLDDKLVRLEKGDDYNSVQKIFLTGFGAFVTPNDIMSIHSYIPKSCIARARLHSFEDQIQFMNTLRGDANVRRGWYCSSKEDVVGILRHGFGRCRKPSVGVAYGTGIYFAPEHHVSVEFCDVDENGVQHMLLCRIIMGSMEQVQPGSEQFQPSHEDFDSGVDDIQNPRLYIVWSTHMNTHIHPEYVVSFKLIPSQREGMTGLKEIRGDAAMAKAQQAISTVSPVRECKNSVPSAHVKLPTSAWLPFSVLFGAIQTSISPSSKKLLDLDYNEFKSKKMTREQFIMRLRTIAGDDLLRSTLRRFQCNPPPAVQSSQQMLMHKGPLN